MSKHKRKHGLVPRMRFPEFRNAPAWNECDLGPMTTKVGSGITPRGGGENYRTEGRIFLRSQNIGWGELILDDVAFIDEKTHQAFAATELKELDVLLNITGASIGRSAVADSRVAGGNVNQHVCIIRVKPKRLDPRILNQYLISEGGQQQIDSFQAGGNRQGLNFGQIRTLSVPLPPTEDEQQKIAACLGSLDDLIAAERRKLMVLRDHKQGLMQQIFPREGETQPRLRFPELQNAQVWTTRQLGDFITERNQYPEESVPLFSLTIENGVTPKTERYERSFLVNDEQDAYKLMLPDDFAFNPMNLRFGAIGRHAGTDKVAVSKYYNIFVCDSTVDPAFCEFYFRSNRMIAFYDSMAIGSLIEKRRVHFGDFLKFDIRFPSLIEQQRIANCLSALDARIAAQAAKLDALRTHKRGLMQQLFPSPEAVA